MRDAPAKLRHHARSNINDLDTLVTHGDTHPLRAIWAQNIQGTQRAYRGLQGGSREYVGKCVTMRHCVTTLSDLARAVVRLCPDHRDPERFHADKDDIAAALRSLARRLGDAA